LCFWDSNNTNDNGYYRLNQPDVSYFERIDMTSNGQYVATDSNPPDQIYVYQGGESMGSIPDARRPNWSANDMLYYIGSDDTLKKLGDPIQQIVQPISDFYDVRGGEIIYWGEGIEIHFIGNDGTITPTPAYLTPHPIMLSPTPQTNSYKLIVVHNSYTANACVQLLIQGTVSQDIICRNSIGTNFDWEAGIDLSFMLPTTQYDCLNPDPSAQPADVINLCIEELAEYGISAFANGLPTSHPNACATWTLNNGTTTYNQLWTLEELQQVMVGVKDTAKAFYMVKNNLFASSAEAQSLTGDSAEEKQIFKTVMDAVPTSEPCNGQIVDVDGFYILRVKNNFKYKNDREYCDFEGWVNGVYVKTENEACTSNSNHAIAFYGSFYPLGLDFIQYTFVHELGH